MVRKEFFLKKKHLSLVKYSKFYSFLLYLWCLILKIRHRYRIFRRHSMKKQLTTVALSAALLLSGGALQAASLASVPSVSGTVVVERNGQKLPVTPGFQLQAGDSIMSLENGSATVSFGSCQVALNANQLFSVDPTQKCAVAPQELGTGAVFLAALGPAAAVGVVAATVTVVGVIRNQTVNDSDGTPASPN